MSSTTVQRKLALIIGNRAYHHGGTLVNPENDANDMARALSAIGFKVTCGLNLGCHEMESYINNFVASIKSSDLVLFYFSGHGTQWEDQNYLLPSDFRNTGDISIKRQAINAQELLDQISKRRPFVTIVILDCCRNYHLRHSELSRGEFSGPQGLKPMYASAGCMISFACAPGEVASDGSGRNGLFTKHLLQHIVRPNEEIQDLMIDVTNAVDKESNGKQTPWQNCSLKHRNIYLSHNDNVAEKPSGQNVVPSNQNATPFMHQPHFEKPHGMHNHSTGRDDNTQWSFTFQSSGYSNTSGSWHHEAHGNSLGSNMNSIIKDAEKRFGIDIDGDGKIG